MKMIFIDMGETLIKFTPRFYEGIYKTLVKLGYNVTEKEVFRATVKHLSKKHFPDNLIKGLAQPNYKEILYELGIVPKKDVISELQKTEIIGSKYELYPDSKKFLEEVKKLGLKIVLLTNATPRVYNIIKELNIDNYIDLVIASCDIGLMKPHPKMFWYALMKGGFKSCPKPCIHIGDVYEIDGYCAQRFGVDYIIVDRNNFYDDLMDINKVRNLLEALELIKKRLKE
jgi:HAD superfamily hydrolase (TIGR01549 family)